MEWRIRNYKAYDIDTGEPLYWSNSDGWVTCKYDIFSEEEMWTLRLPLEGYWEPISKLYVFDVDYPIITEVFDANGHTQDEVAKTWNAVWDECFETGDLPGTDADVIHDTMRQLGITQYRVRGHEHVTRG